MVIALFPFFAVVLLICGGFSSIGLSGWYHLSGDEGGTAGELAKPACDCHCQCESSTSTLLPSSVLEVTFLSEERAGGFLWGAIAGIIFCCCACCVGRIFSKRAKRSVDVQLDAREVSDSETSSVILPVSKDGSPRAEGAVSWRTRVPGHRILVWYNDPDDPCVARAGAALAIAADGGGRDFFHAVARPHS